MYVNKKKSSRVRTKKYKNWINRNKDREIKNWIFLKEIKIKWNSEFDWKKGEKRDLLKKLLQIVFMQIPNIRKVTIKKVFKQLHKG